MRLPDAVRLAVGTLTAVRVPAPRAVTRSTASGAMLLAPLAALVLLVPTAAVVATGRALGLGALVLSVLAVGTLAVGTRALHLDGLADTVDGLAASYDRDRALEVMRTGDVGPAGASALLLVLALQIACAASVLDARGGPTLAAVALVGSRLALTWACVRSLPAARPGGLGALVAGTVPPVRAAAATVVVGCAAALATGLTGAGWWAGPVVVAVGPLAAVPVLLRCRRRLGGITGDVLGAVVEIALAGGLLVATALI
ncbi:adenosylcobinamide-GDP ribazoletransferase [Luteipulveratus sp. YIM 133132]|uniref:adenosylcobinamide-GDP ribazoletransferase n=1 Tax=Luteipulveratus flavus TaxID=3031728 RepID=UPI0023AF0243|nr:adenosylcobinamide-GDP ribazoletransferase [Luteipulveratus sp. YIM 133132]MDE9366435.1 adenosylcobinamide-GDP ribazoletransferase [Luteipulveratus sp. YIM 133132]